MNMNPLAVVTPLYIYHGCSTQKTFWEGKFTLDEFIAVNMKNCGRRNGIGNTERSMVVTSISPWTSH